MTDVDYKLQNIHNVEDIAKEHFGVELYVKKIIVGDIITGIDTYATLFKDTENKLYALIESEQNITLANVVSMVKSMNMEAKGYLAPYGESDYFDKRGREAFRAVFPSRKISDVDISFYQTFTVYSPALVRISHICGDLNSYNIVSKQWRKEYDESFIKMRITEDE